MPFELLTAHWRQIPRLQANESLLAFEVGAATGDVSLQKNDRQRLVKTWQKTAQPRRRKHAAPMTREERFAALAGMGIPVVFEEPADA